MNRAHAYKAKVEQNKEAGLEVDAGVNMGLYTYPILMAADILLFQATHVPVEKTKFSILKLRDIATYFNHTFGTTFTLPEYVVQEEGAILPGLDGRKMSKSYGNVIPLFAEQEKLRKLIFKNQNRLHFQMNERIRNIIYDIKSLRQKTKYSHYVKNMRRNRMGRCEKELFRCRL